MPHRDAVNPNNWQDYEIVRNDGEHDGERVFTFAAPTPEYAADFARDWADRNGEAIGSLETRPA